MLLMSKNNLVLGDMKRLNVIVVSRGLHEQRRKLRFPEFTTNCARILRGLVVKLLAL